MEYLNKKISYLDHTMLIILKYCNAYINLSALALSVLLILSNKSVPITSINIKIIPILHHMNYIIEIMGMGVGWKVILKLRSTGFNLTKLELKAWNWRNWNWPDPKSGVRGIITIEVMILKSVHHLTITPA